MSSGVGMGVCVCICVCVVVAGVCERELASAVKWAELGNSSTYILSGYESFVEIRAENTNVETIIFI